jgi:cytochrome c oxidase subunit 4
MSSTHSNAGIRIYLYVYVALLLLLFATVGFAFIRTGNHHALRDLLTTTGFLIAGIKAVLIILWFMHVKGGTRLTWVFASAAFVWLVIMFSLSLNDYLARNELPAQGGAYPQQTGTSSDTLEFRPEDSTGMHSNR